MRIAVRVVLIFAGASLLSAEVSQKPLPAKVVEAKSVLIVCECPRGLAVAEDRAIHELALWGRFRIVRQRDAADLVFLFSGNQYLGDYLTRDGPDTRPVSISFTILTVIDPKTGASLWSDSRRWGSWRVDSATKALIAELKDQIEAQTKKWTLNDILMCSASPALAAFAHLTAEEALAKPKSGVTRIASSPDRLTVKSPLAPDFCKQAQLVVDPDNRIVAFEVLASQVDTLDVNELVREADKFDFTGGKEANNDAVYFTAQTKDRKVLIRFEVQGHRSVLSRVRYSY